MKYAILPWSVFFEFQTEEYIWLSDIMKHEVVSVGVAKVFVLRSSLCFFPSVSISTSCLACLHTKNVAKVYLVRSERPDLRRTITGIYTVGLHAAYRLRIIASSWDLERWSFLEGWKLPAKYSIYQRKRHLKLNLSRKVDLSNCRPTLSASVSYSMK